MVHYMPRNVCSRKVTFDIKDKRVKNVKFERGCDGSLKAISKLIDGMRVEEAIKILKGIRCANKTTSCPDQLARALEKYLNE